MRTLSSVSFVLGMLFASTLLLGPRATAADTPPAGKVYELRVYHANPGKLEALHARFRDHTCKLFQKHGMELIGFWTPTKGKKPRTRSTTSSPSPSPRRRRSPQAFRETEWYQGQIGVGNGGGRFTTKVESKNMKATDYLPLR